MFRFVSIAVISLSTLISACSINAGTYGTVGGTSNNCLVTGTLLFPTTNGSSNVFRVFFSDSCNNEGIVADYDYFVLGRVNIPGTNQKYEIHIPAGNYWIYSYVNNDTNSGITAGDFAGWHGSGFGIPPSSPTLNIPSSGTQQMTITMVVK
jgi:hypothetical protein